MSAHTQSRSRVKPRVIYIICLALAPVLVAMFSCNGNSSPIGEASPSLTPITSQVFFPRQKLPEDIRSVATGKIFGKLTLINGCLRGSFADTSYLVVWPPNFTFSIVEGTIQIHDDAGHIVARSGEEVCLDGGGVQSTETEWLSGLLEDKLSLTCPGPYWLVGYVVRPNIRQDSDLFHLDVIYEGDDTLFFISRKPLLDSWLADASVDAWIEKSTQIAGELKLFSRSLHVVTENYPLSFVPIWPPSYEASFENGVTTIVDKTSGKTIRVGDNVVLEGYKSINPQSVRYTRLRNELPGECNGPYLVVSDIVTTSE